MTDLAGPNSIPPGPAQDYQPAQSLLDWMGGQFEQLGHIYRASLYGAEVYVTRDPDHAHHVLVDNWQNYVKGLLIKRIALLLGNGLMVSEGELWKRQRRMVQPALHGEAITVFTRMIVAVNSALRERWRSAAERSESVNVTRDVSGMALEVVLRAIFGGDYEQAGYHFGLVSENPQRDMAFASAFRNLRPVILEAAARRRNLPPDSSDVLGMLLRARDAKSGQPMEERNLVNEIITLIVAGHETTASTLNWTWYLLSQHPEAEEKLAREVAALPGVPDADDLPKTPYARQVIDEALRLYPAGWLLTRKALRDDRLGSYFVPAGTEIYIPPYFIQRRPDLWDDAGGFHPERFDSFQENRNRRAMVPFSAGPRNCVGEPLSRLEMRLHLLMIARELRLRYPPSQAPELEAGVNLRSKHDFVMYPEIRTLAKPMAAQAAQAAKQSA
ncbi:MAG TPA: cytochrome P450 [Bryobacteraceae bacterium]|nr:cytochrome P450 [Bryobacteraceae bacterium]